MKYVALLVLLAACDGPDRRDAQNISNLVGRIRNDDNAGVDDLKNAPCQQLEVCQTRDACVATLEPKQKALKLKREVEIGVAALEAHKLDKTSEEAKALPKKIDDAERLLEEGQQKQPLCDERLADVKRRFRL